MGTDEVPENSNTYNSLTRFINQINSIQNQQGFNLSIWNDSILKSQLSKLNPNITIDYWSQSGNNNDINITNDRYLNRISVSDIIKSGHGIVNCNSYATYYQMKYIGNENDDSYFINYLNNTIKPNIFNEINFNGNNQNWTVEKDLKINGMMVSLWGENSDNITSDNIVDFINKLNIPQ